MADDILTELDRWLVSRASLHEATVSHALLQAARDEIVALRAKCIELSADRTKQLVADRTGFGQLLIPKIQDALVAAREQALEEAEIACLTEARDYVISLGQDNYRDGCRNCAAAIRLLKDKGQ